MAAGNWRGLRWRSWLKRDDDAWEIAEVVKAKTGGPDAEGGALAPYCGCPAGYPLSTDAHLQHSNDTVIHRSPSAPVLRLTAIPMPC